MEAHHVVDAQEAGDGQLMLDDVGKELVSIAPAALRMERRETPVLAAGEKGVGGRAEADAVEEEIAMTPVVEAVRVRTEGEVEIQGLPALCDVSRKRRQLEAHHPLRPFVPAHGRG